MEGKRFGGYEESGAVVHLLRCPCRRHTGSPWPRGSRPPASPTGRCSATRWPPGCSVHCCCRDPGSPLPNEHTAGVVRDKRGGRGAAGQQGPVQASTNRRFFGTCGDDSFFVFFCTGADVQVDWLHQFHSKNATNSAVCFHFLRKGEKNSKNPCLKLHNSQQEKSEGPSAPPRGMSQNAPVD